MDEQQPAQPAQEDISNKTILLLVILTLAVSFIGAWVNINSAMTATAPEAAAAPSSNAEVNFFIQKPQPPMQEQATAMVSLELTQ